MSLRRLLKRQDVADDALAALARVKRLNSSQQNVLLWRLVGRMLVRDIDALNENIEAVEDAE